MRKETNPTTPKPLGENPTFSLGLIRAIWTFLGPLLLTVAIVYGAGNSEGWLTIGDVMPALVVVVMILCRWIEQRSGNPMTAYGEPSTPKHFQQWVIILIVGTGLGWILANIIGNYVLDPN